MQEEEFEQPAPAEAPSGSTRPKWLSAVTISAIVAASLFGCCGLFTVGGLFAGQAMSAAMPKMSGDAEAQFLERTQAIQKEMFPLALSTGLLGLAHAGALLLGGILAYRRMPIGRRLLVAVFFAGVVVECLNGYVSALSAQKQSVAMETMVGGMMVSKGADDGDRPDPQAVANSFARLTSIASWIMVLGFLAVKSAYYIVCALYLRQPAVVAYFEPPPAPAS